MSSSLLVLEYFFFKIPSLQLDCGKRVLSEEARFPRPSSVWFLSMLEKSMVPLAVMLAHLRSTTFLALALDAVVMAYASPDSLFAMWTRHKYAVCWKKTVISHVPEPKFITIVFPWLSVLRLSLLHKSQFCVDSSPVELEMMIVWWCIYLHPLKTFHRRDSWWLKRRRFAVCFRKVTVMVDKERSQMNFIPLKLIGKSSKIGPCPNSSLALSCR